MHRKIYQSFLQLVLVKAYHLLARHANLGRGPAAWLYSRSYLYYKRHADAALLRASEHFVTNDSLVIDVGANIGAFALEIARRFHVKVIAFEPDETNFSQLLALTPRDILNRQVFPYRLALSDRTGTSKLYLSDLAPTDHKLINTRSTRSVDIAATTLDEFLETHAELSSTPVTLIKIDVQGAELMVLRGMRKTLRRHNYPPILVEYSPDDLIAAGVIPADFFLAFEALGYRPHRVTDLSRRDPAWIAENTRSYTDLLMIAEAAPQCDAMRGDSA